MQRRALLGILFVVSAGITSCSGTPEPKPSSGLLEAVPETPSASSAPTPAVEPAAPAPSPAYEKLLKTLKALGYDAVGLEYENEATTDLLMKVFADPKSHRRRIKLVYTGAQMAYDARHESLTVGGTSDVLQILAFIQKTVPAR